MQEIFLVYQIVWISVAEVVNVEELVFVWLARNIICWYNMLHAHFSELYANEKID